jgi:hypothetical protein
MIDLKFPFSQLSSEELSDIYCLHYNCVQMLEIDLADYAVEKEGKRVN